MKNLIRLIFGSAVLLAFSQCGSSQVFTTDPPFQLGEVSLEPWTAGADKKITGVNIFFPVTDGRSIVLDTVYYRYQKAPLMRIAKDNYLVFKGQMTLDTAPYDLVMHADPKKEVGNTPPPLARHDFKLEPDEVVVGYSDGKKRGFYKTRIQVTGPAIHYEKNPVVKNTP